MKNSTSVLLGVCFVGVVASLGLANRWGALRGGATEQRAGAPQETTRQPSHEGPQSGIDNAVLSAQLGALVGEVARLKEQLAAQSAAPDMDAGGATAGAVEPPAKSVEEAKEEWHAHMTEVEADFNAEQPNPGWANETKSLIAREVDSEPALRDAVRKMECRSQSCRLELAESGSAEVEQAIPLLLHKLGVTLPVSKSEVVDEGGGKLVRVVYLMQESES